MSLLKMPYFLLIVIAYHAYVSVIKSSKESCTIAVIVQIELTQYGNCAHSPSNISDRL